MAGGIRSSGGGRKPTLPTGQKSKLTRIAPPAELMGEAAISGKRKAKYSSTEGCLSWRTHLCCWLTAMLFI